MVGHKTDTVVGVENAVVAGTTWNTGDTINGNGLTRISLIEDGGLGNIVDANNIAAVNVNLVDDSSLEELEFDNVASVVVTNGVAGSELQADNADLTTVHGLAKAGRNFDLVVDYDATLTGTADTALLSVAGTGVSKDVFSTIDVTNGNLIDAVSLTTSGANFVTINGGTGAKNFTITGSGANDITIGTAHTTLTVDASGTTGANTLRLGTHLSGTTDTVTGGSGVDTLVATIGNTTVSTISAVENFDLTFSAAATFNASRITGVEALDITNTGAATISNLVGTVDTVTFDTSAAGAGATISYVSGTATDLTVNVGKRTTAGDSTAIVAVGGLTLANNAADVVINSVSDKATTINTTGAIALGTATSLEIDANAAVTAGNITGTKATSLQLDAYAGAIITGTYAAADSLGSVTINATGGSVTTGLISVDDSLTTITIDTGSGSADYATETSFGKSGTAAAKAAVNGVLEVTGSGDTQVTIADADTFIGTVDATAATGSVTLNFQAYTGSSGFVIDLGNAGTGETNTANVAGAAGSALITGGSGADVITGGSGADVLNSGAGNDAVTGNAGADVITLGAGTDTYNFANQRNSVHASNLVATVANANADVGNDVLESFVTADDTFIIDETVFGTNIGVRVAGELTGALTHFVSVATTTSSLGGAYAVADTGSIVVVQAGANAPASVYYVDSTYAAGATVADLLAAGTPHATLIGTVSTVTGTVATGDFLVVL